MTDAVEGEPPYLAGIASGVRCYHTDPDCDRLLEGRNPRPVSESMVEWHELGECVDCAGVDYHNRGGEQPAISGGEQA